MAEMDFNSILARQQQFFSTNATLSYDFRIEQLKKLKALIEFHENDITTALKKDLNKAPMEGLVSEILLVIDEIDFIIKNLKKWMRPKKVSTRLPLWPAKSEIHFEPYGSALIMGPWNYPFLLIMSPLVGAISAGNCAVIKPSEIASHTQDIICQIINDNFSSDYLFAIKAGPEQTTKLLQERFDYLFFTGGTQIGKVIMEAASKNLTPLTLELGGKSPCIVDQTANIDFAARRIAWAKTTNAGQVCIAPDYLYVHHSRKEELIKKIIEAMKQFYGEDAATSESYGRIINQKHFSRIKSLMQKGRIVFGGQTNEVNLFIAPTIIDDVTWNDPIMQEEIFGPLLPILTYDKIEDVIHTIKQRPKPLALYVFTKDKTTENKILQQVSYGGGCINDCILQVANMHLPFGGVGASGLGHYHGNYSFHTFSHAKSIYKKILPIDPAVQYPPYSAKKLWWVRKLFTL